MTLICKNCGQNLEDREEGLWARVGDYKCIPPMGLNRPIRDAHEPREEK